MHDVHVLRCTGRVIFSYTVRYWKRVVPIAIIRRKFSASKLNSPVRLSTNYRNSAFWRLETGTRVADVTRSFGCSEQTIYRLQTRYQRPGVKNDKPPLGRPRITTPFEVRVIVTSTWRNRFWPHGNFLNSLVMQQIREFPSVLPEIVWWALDWFLSYNIWILILTTLSIFDKKNGYIFGMICWKWSHL